MTSTSKPCGTGFIWRDDEKELVRQLYDGTKKSIFIIQYCIKEKSGIERTFNAIQHMSCMLGLSRYKKVTWSEDGIEQLKKLAGKYPLDKIARKLHRSTSSVSHKAQELNIKLRQRNDWYTMSEVREILGISAETFSRLVQENKLVAQRFSNKPCSLWQIKSDDLRNFIIKYSYELNSRKSDITQIVALLCPKEFDMLARS